MVVWAISLKDSVMIQMRIGQGKLNRGPKEWYGPEMSGSVRKAKAKGKEGTRSSAEASDDEVEIWR